MKPTRTIRTAASTWVASGALCFAIIASPINAQSIQLRQGTILVGEIQDATGDGLTFRRLDNGGVLELGWSDLSQTSADRVRRLKGLLVEDEEPVTVIADVLVFEVAGGIRETIVGRIVDEGSKTFSIRRKSATLDVKRSSIKDRKRREVPILEIYTREDYYQEQLAKFGPGKEADKHVALADELRRAGDLRRSETHLLEAQKLGGGRQGTQVVAMLARVRALIESEAERGLLTRIRQMTNREKFDVAADLIVQFEGEFPDSKLANDLERERRRLGRARKASLIERMRSMWGQKLHRVATNVVTSPKLTLARARDYAETKMAEDVFGDIAGTLKIELEEAQSLWEVRNEDKQGRNTAFSYGVGSWVLGEEDIIKGTKVAEGGKGGLDDNESDDPELKRIIKLIRDQKKRARDLARRNGGAEESDESWWKALKLSEKRQWLRVYFAEHGGQMEVVRATALPCFNCSGAGSIASLGTSGKPTKEKCPVCRGTRYTRVIRAR